MAVDRVAELTLQGASLIFFAPFSSLYFQIPGLYGPNGLLPVDGLIPQSAQLDPGDFWANPNLFIFSKRFGFSVSEFMEVVSILGMVVSSAMALFKNIRGTVSFVFLFVAYLSLYRAGQTFMHFQWDIMLLEFGVLCILMTLSPAQGIALCRWLLLRLLFHSGFKKLESGCPTWWGLTALDWHFESQCIPTPLAYHAHQLPKIFLKIGVLVTYISQLGIVLFALSPSRRLRIFSGWVHIFHQLGILATGNYNFFNLLTILLAFTCFDDLHLGIKKENEEKKEKIFLVKTFWFALEALQFVLMAFAISKSIVFDSDGQFQLSDSAEKQSKLINLRDFVLIPLSIIGFSSLIFGFLKERRFGFKNIAAMPLSLLIFTASLSHFYDIDRPLQRKFQNHLKSFPFINDLDERFELTHSYGLFRRMTGVGGRPEVVVEVEIDDEFVELEFPYKPTSLDRECPWCFPHQPRLDWQMWFAALSPRIEHDPWLVTLAIRLLQDSSDVQDLFHNYQGSFELRKIKSVKMFKYKYSYTEPGEQGIWKRRDKTEHLGIITLEHEGLRRYIAQNNMELKNYQKNEYLDGVRLYLKRFAPEKFIWASYATFFCLNFFL